SFVYDVFFFSSRRRHTRFSRDWSSDVCSSDLAAMTHGFKIVEDMIDGLKTWMDGKGYRTIEDFRGLAVPNFVEWQDLNLNYKVRSEERRVGKESRARRWGSDGKKKRNKYRATR